MVTAVSIGNSRKSGVCCLLAVCCGMVPLGAGAVEPVRFSRDVLPILSDKCFQCHGPDADARKAKLRLDLEAEARAPRADGSLVLAPGDPDKSLLIQRLISPDPGEVMPPPDSVKQLSAGEVATLKAWVEQGAPWETHWSHTKVRRPPLPPGADGRHPVDAFIDARLAAEGLKANGPADAATWLRRVALDLTGLPPSLAQTRRFLAHPDRGAAIDALLASPAYGERMAWDWLEVARYADTHGYQKDNLRSMWRWRDWVVDAFNQNLPFDQFTIEQLAGDLLPNPTTGQIIATGFNRNHRINAEAGAIDEEFRIEYVVDRVETMATAWMGLTAGCARCHDHKFDPLSQREFFSLFAFFNNIDERGNDGVGAVAEPALTLSVPGMEPALKEKQRLLAASDKALDAAAQAADVQSWRLEQQERLRGDGLWQVLEPQVVKGQDKGSVFTPQSDGSVLFEGANPLNDVHEVRVSLGRGLTLQSLRLEALPDARLTSGSLARSFDGAFLLSELEIEVGGAVLPVRTATASVAVADGAVGLALDGDPLTGWRVPGGVRQPVWAVFSLTNTVALPAGAELVVRLRYESREEQFMIGRFRLSAGGSDLAADAPEMRQSLVEAVLGGEEEALWQVFRESAPGLAALRERREMARQELAAAEAAATTSVMVMRERDGEPRPAHVLKRGLYDQPGDAVQPDVPAFVNLPLPPAAPRNRLTLARWLVDPGHPLTARVVVNRLWQMAFGTGLVQTGEDFGFQGAQPTHPELLDWLAAELIESGWNVKALLRLLTTSETYARSAHVTPELLERDPDNRLLARAPRLRLPGPVLRDQALAVSGLLVSRAGGPPTRPYQPPGLWEAVAGVNSNTVNYVQDHGEDLHRRSLYTLWKRSVPPPNMMLFDAAGRDICSVARPRTNSPLQALVTLNDVTFAEAARVLAERVLEEKGDADGRRLRRMAQIILGRAPDAGEVGVLEDLLRSQRARYQSDRAGAMQRVAVGESPVNLLLDPREVAAWTEVAEVLLNLDSTLTRP